MYYEYWGLSRPPFDNVPDPTMYFSAHQTVEQAVGEVLFAIEEGDECLAVVVGEVGLGKTTALRVVLDSLDQDKYRIAFVTNPDITFSMLLREIVGQLKGEPCQIRRKDQLLEEFNHVLFATADEGKRVLIFIDEGNAFKPVNLESMRLLTNMQEDDRNLFTIVLAGQPKLAKMLEAPARANLFQRIGVYCHLEKMDSWEVVRDYIDHRLERGGRTESIFTEEAIRAIYQYSEEGVPRLVNKIAKLALKAGETCEAPAVGTEIIESIGERFKRFTGKRKKAPVQEAKPEAVTQEDAQTPVQEAEVSFAGPESNRLASLEWGPQEPTDGEGIWPASRESSPEEMPEAETDQEDNGGYYYEPKRTDEAEEFETDHKLGEVLVESGAVEPEHVDAALEMQQNDPSGRKLGEILVESGVISEAQVAAALTQQERTKLAGRIAAEEIKKHPEYTAQRSDPVVAWQELRNEILSAMES